MRNSFANWEHRLGNRVRAALNGLFAKNCKNHAVFGGTSTDHQKNPTKGGALQFGTEVVASQDSSIASLLGESHGESTAAPFKLKITQRCFQDKLRETHQQPYALARGLTTDHYCISSRTTRLFNRRP
ncbi:MAG: malate:quinone oxidoreductase [Verrucomicrobiota bacterium]